MKIRTYLAVMLAGLTATLALAADVGFEGTWVTDGVAVYQAAIDAKKSTSGLPEAAQMKVKVDTKKNTVSGSILLLIPDKEYQIKDGKLNDKTVTFNSVDSSAPTPTPVAWKGELKDENTILLFRLDKDGKAGATPTLTFHRPVKK
jgi:hypothetical protein